MSPPRLTNGTVDVEGLVLFPDELLVFVDANKEASTATDVQSNLSVRAIANAQVDTSDIVVIVSQS